MFDDVRLGARVLTNPGIVQALAIRELESRLGGTYSVADGNNPFCFQLEASSSFTAQFVRWAEQKFNALYPTRAQTSDELYGHMSDYDYVNLTASPADANFCMIIPASWVVENAVAVDSTYKKLSIPASSPITLGSRTFSLYYPIVLLVNTNTGEITAEFDTSVANPLKTLSANMLPECLTFTKDSIKYLKLVFSASQFNVTSKVDTLNSTGYTKTFTYSDKFYNARVFTRSSANSTWSELAYSLSSATYDPSVPTALLTLLEDNSSVRIQIPQIYFTTGLLGNQIRIDLYTTEGALNVAIPINDAHECSIDIKNEDAYSQPFTSCPYISIFPYNQSLITGGSDPMDFSTFRTRLIEGGLYDTVPVNRAQLRTCASKYGFNLTDFVDSFLKRIYFASALMQNTTTGRITPTGVIGINLKGDSLSGNPGTILSYTDNMYTILPTTLFSYNATNNTCTPLTDAQVSRLAGMAISDLVTELNNKLYLRQPFHITMSTGDTPQAKTYNLANPTCDSILLVEENPTSVAMMSIANAVVIHNSNGTGGYTIRLGIQKSATLTNMTADDFVVAVMVGSRSGTRVYTTAEYYGSTSTLDIWDVAIPTSYHISIDNYLQTQLLSPSGSATTCEIPLSTTFDVRLMVKSSLFPATSNESTLVTGLPDAYTSDYLVMCQQSLTISFGTDLSDYVYNVVTTDWGTEAYATYPEDIYHTYPRDIYQVNNEGIVNVRVVSDASGIPTVEHVTLFNDGDTVPDKSNITVTTVGETLAGSDTITLSSTVNIRVGLVPTCLGVLSTAYITNIENNVITLSQPVTVNIPDGSNFTVLNTFPTTRVNTAQSAISETVALVSTSGIGVGMTVFGFDIPSGTTVASVDPSTNTITLSQMPTAILDEGVYLTFINPTSPGYVMYPKGTVKTDASGNPISITERQNQYVVQAIMFDARLYASTDTNDAAYVSGLPAQVQSYTANVEAFAAQVWELPEVYFRPNRTIGTATFNTGGGASVTMDLGLSFTVTLYVTSGAYNDANLKSAMETSTINLITQAVRNDVISLIDIGSTLQKAFGDYLVAASFSGINDNPDLQVVSVSDTEVAPTINQYLVVNSDNSVSLTPDITVSIIEAPETKDEAA